MTKTNDYPSVANRSGLAVERYRTAYPLWERLAVRALVSVVVGKDPRRHIHRARIAARRAEFERNFERAERERAKGARI